MPENKKEIKDISSIDNFKSTADLTGNPGFKSTLSINDADELAVTYNPFEHRQVTHPNTVLGSILHLLKACLGSGILAMPAAFKNSGMIIGTVGTLIAGFLCTHTVHILVRTSQDVCVDAKTPSMGFAETCGAAFTYGPKKLRSWGGTIKTVVDYSMFFTYISVLCVYVVFIASSFKEVLDYYYPEHIITIRMYCLLTLVPLILICQIRNLKHLVPFSATANLLIVVVFGITMYFVFIELPPISDREYVASWTTWPLFFSTVIFAMEGIGVIMPVENEMAKPHKFLGCPGVLNISMFIVIILYATFGFFGYLQFGNEVKGSITLNLPQDYWIAQTAKLLMALVIYFSFALQMYVPMEMINRMLAKRNSTGHEHLIQVSIRTGLVIFAVAMAIAFPDLEIVISLVGAIFFSTLGLFIPAVVETIYRWDRDLGFCYWVLWKNIIIIIMAIIALVSGSYVSISAFFSEEEHNNTANGTLTI